MLFARVLRSQSSHLLSLTPHANPKRETLVTLSQVILNSSTNQRYVSTSALHEQQGETDEASSEAGGAGSTNAKPYDVVFKEAVGLIEPSGDLEGEIEGDAGGVGGGEVGKKLWELEMELKELMSGNENNGKLEWKSRKWWRKKEIETEDEEQLVIKRVKENNVSSGDSVELGEKSKRNDEGEKRVTGDEVDVKPRTSLSALFARKAIVRKDSVLEKEQQKGIVADKNRIVREREDLIVKELSPDMQVFVRHLYDEGYFKDANFLPQNQFDVSCFESSFARNFLISAAEKYGRDKQEIAKWLSGNDLKQIALFGCPSLTKRAVFTAKSLRTYFQIPEARVCRKCVLREKCKFVNQSIWNKNTKQLKLQPVIRLLTIYALEAVPAELVVSDDVKDCVSRLMKNVMNLSKTVS